MISWHTGLRIGLLTAGAIVLLSCGQDTVAGKTTTTSNGGDLLARGPDGRPLAGCIALASRSWNQVSGSPGTIDTLRGDSAGRIRLDHDLYAVLEIRDATGFLGAAIRKLAVAQGENQAVALDSLRPMAGRWADHAGIARGRLFLDSSFQTASLAATDGAFRFERVPPGVFTLMLDADSQSVRAMGSVRLQAGEVRYQGSGNVVIEGDTTRSPLWIDDFESGRIWPMLLPSVPAVSPWFMWWSGANMTVPVSVDPDSILGAIGPDPTRGGRTFQAKFTTTGANSWVAAGITNMRLDLRSRSQVCLGYRTDAPFKLEFQLDSIDGVRPTVSATLPAAIQWRDTCVATSSFLPDPGTPDSLRTWNTFARRVLVIQFLASAGATHMELDDIRMR